MAGGEPADLVFVQLSDIHFRKGRADDLHDEDADLRNELERDLRSAGNLVPRIDSIAISGDIAFSGQAPEYQTAAAWLRSIAEQVSCPHGGILPTPGNHDVNRSRLPEGCEALDFHLAVQNAADSERRDAMIAARLRDPANGPALFAALQEYNDFATLYGCAVAPDAPYWERSFPLSDGSSLCVRGMTTTLISGPLDDKYPQKLVYGGAQKTFLRADGVRRMLIGHHPPSWTLDDQSAVQVFANRNLLQMFGHVHSHWISHEGNSVRIFAGAVHPDRGEAGWDPRYNIVAVSVENPTTLKVRILPRRWSREEMMFVADRRGDGSIDRVYRLPIEKFVRPTQVQVPRSTHTGLVQWGKLAERLQRVAPSDMKAIAADLGLFITSEEDSQPMRLVTAAATTGRFRSLRQESRRSSKRHRWYAGAKGRDNAPELCRLVPTRFNLAERGHAKEAVGRNCDASRSAHKRTYLLFAESVNALQIRSTYEFWHRGSCCIQRRRRGVLDARQR